MERNILKLFYLALFFGYAVCYVSQTWQSYETIVIGLGSAGTTAASTLAKAGKRVLALEAQDRIGGRVMTVPFGDGVVELGAEWIHGTEHSRVYETAVKNNISVFPQDTSFAVYKSDGSLGNKELIKELLDFCLETVGHPPDKPEQLGKFLNKKLMNYIKEKHPEILSDQDFINEFRDLMNFIINSYQASNDWNDVTAQSDYEALEGNQEISWHRYGYKTFLDLLLNTYNNGPGWPSLEIKLNKEVTLIKWPKNSTGNVEVLCKDGSVYIANNVIVTVSLGVLKERALTLFSPTIPDRKLTVIDKLSIGVVGKTIFSFQRAWWPDVVGFILFWSPEDREVYKNDPWVLQLKDVATPMGSGNTLTFWANGDTAKLIETLPEDVVKSKMMEVLKKFLGKNVTVPEPTGMIRSKWYSNPFTRGSYTYDNLLKHDYPYARAILGEPLLDATGSPKVLFAGEATDLTHFSTVHGASESGYREALRLLPQTVE
ncbi:probable polyamine oxidase 5 isoform X1 [Pararge aegeria]|uniref:probable polyamine oxidase 5 isoform X1 n=1 Tax=Pararge aegeria TaxID=116150 RepID=UPI0019D0872D|nr:probable polyamine oxidase 5 isoform X1 [Pararge aegeria]